MGNLRLNLLLVTLSLLFSCTSNINKPEGAHLITSQELASLDGYLLSKININDDIIISEEFKNENNYNKQFNVLTIQYKLKTEKYEELMDLIQTAEDLFEKEPTLTNENALLDLYYSFYINRIDYSNYFDNWITLYPESNIPYIARGIFRSALAWKFRGDKYTQKTKKIRLIGMELLFESAGRDLYKALDIKQSSLPAHLYLISLKKTGGFGSMHDAFYVARQYQPKSRYLVEWYATNLEPWWGGKDKHWDKLNNHLKETTPEYLPLINGLKLAIKAEQFRRNNDKLRFEQTLKLANDFEGNLYTTSLNYKEQSINSLRYIEIAKLLKNDFSWNRHLEKAISVLTDSQKYQQCIRLSNIAILRGEINRWTLNDRAYCFAKLNMYKESRESLVASLKYQSPPENKWAANFLKLINLKIESTLTQ